MVEESTPYRTVVMCDQRTVGQKHVVCFYTTIFPLILKLLVQIAFIFSAKYFFEMYHQKYF